MARLGSALAIAGSALVIVALGATAVGSMREARKLDMYPRAFHYHRAGSLKEASAMLSEFGDDAKLLAGGQSLIPLMKLRYANPSHLVDLNFISGTSYIKEENGTLQFRGADPPC